MSARDALKAATDEAHQRVDVRFALLDLANRADYAQFLTAHAAAFLPLEEALAAAGADDVLTGWGAHRRSDALRRDLADFDLPVPKAVTAPGFDGEASMLGGLYVLEGSRLGGAVLRRQVGPGFPRWFLDSVHAPGRWPALIGLLDRKLSGPDALERAVDAALASFGMFERADWGRVDG